MTTKYIKLTKLEYEGKLQIDAVKAKLDADIKNLDDVQEEEEPVNNLDFDDDSDLFNHHKKEPWGYVR